jgi:hypothetical protein
MNNRGGCDLGLETIMFHSIKSRLIAVMAALLAVAAAGATTAALAQKRPKFPIVFDKADRLAEAGIKIQFAPGEAFTHFPNKCYYYGDGGISLSVSDDLLARYKAKGFTLHSLCLGLVSEARFNPETGKRLPTYVLVDRKALKSALNGRDPKRLTERQLAECCSEPGTTSEEQPLVLPACFKNGTPYRDCDWRYGVKTGVKVRDVTRENFRKLGAEIERIMAVAIAGKLVCNPEANKPCTAEQWRDKSADMGNSADFLAPEGNDMIFLLNGEKRPDLKISPSLTAISKASFFDVSKAFPAGYGYALNAVGDAGPGVSTSSIKAALGDGEPESQVSSGRLRELMDDE